MAKSTTIDIICDNGGSITLQYHGRYRYVHVYDSGDHAINDLHEIANGGDPEDWDGNEYEESGGYCYYSNKEEAIGSYRWYIGTAKQLLDEFSRMNPDEAWGNNVSQLIAAAQAYCNA